MSLYIIAIGGTGARCVEAITHLSACGVFGDHSLNILFVDPDESNGNLSRSRSALDRYQKCRQQFYSKQGTPLSWMRTKLVNLGLWSPFEGTPHKTLNDLFDYNNYRQQNPNLGHLFDVLYTPKERTLQLDVGFYGRPAIGAAVMSRWQEEIWKHPAWEKFIQGIKQDLGEGKSPRVFLIGSIFGGTGAAGLPTIQRLIANKLVDEGKREAVKLGGLLMLPYFQFPAPTADVLYARSDTFLLHTQAALRYYRSQQTESNDALNFDVTYLLGVPDLTRIEFSSVGRESQRNAPHFIELYAALAAKNFLQNPPKQPVVLISRGSSKQIQWSDIPDQNEEVKLALVNATRFAFAWLSGIQPDLDLMTKGDRETGEKTEIQEFQEQAPWFSEFFQPEQGFLKFLIPNSKALPDFRASSEQEAIALLSQWCKAYLIWLHELHISGEDRIELFNASALEMSKVDDLSAKVDDFSGLVLGTLLEERKIAVRHLKARLTARTAEPAGTVGLARALYALCDVNQSRDKLSRKTL